MVLFWEVADRAINTGRLMKVKDFDFLVFNSVSRLVKENGIKYDPKTPIPADDDLADRIFEAGVKFYVGGLWKAIRGKAVISSNCIRAWPRKR